MCPKESGGIGRRKMSPHSDPPGYERHVAQPRKRLARKQHAPIRQGKLGYIVLATSLTATPQRLAGQHAAKPFQLRAQRLIGCW